MEQNIINNIGDITYLSELTQPLHARAGLIRRRQRRVIEAATLFVRSFHSLRRVSAH